MKLKFKLIKRRLCLLGVFFLLFGMLSNTTLAFADIGMQPTVDKTILITAVADGNTLWSTSVFGTDPGQYDLFDRWDYYMAIFHTQEVVDNSNATQEDVDTAVVTLADRKSVV